MLTSSTTVISAERHERLRQFLKDLWDYRELFYTFLERDIKVRYKQTALGAIWVILQPLVATGAYVLIFGKIARMPTDGLPYALFYFAATVPWSAFARELNGSALSIEGNAHLISKIYFPRVVVPFAVVTASLVDFLIGWGTLNIVGICMGYWSWHGIGPRSLERAVPGCKTRRWIPRANHDVGHPGHLPTLASPTVGAKNRLHQPDGHCRGKLSILLQRRTVQLVPADNLRLGSPSLLRLRILVFPQTRKHTGRYPMIKTQSIIEFLRGIKAPSEYLTS